MSTNFTPLNEWVLAVIATLGGWRLVNWILNRKEIKRKALAEAISLETDSLVKRYNTMESELEKLKSEVEELQRKVAVLQEDKLDLIKENNELKLALQEAQSHVCMRPDDECLKRMPPRMYCRLKRLSNGWYDKWYEDKNEDDDVEVFEKSN